MEPGRDLAITKLKMRILACTNEKKRLQAIIDFSHSAERRAQAHADLATLFKEIGEATDKLKKLDPEESQA
jgi:hypothetical protein